MRRSLLFSFVGLIFCSKTYIDFSTLPPNANLSGDVFVPRIDNKTESNNSFLCVMNPVKQALGKFILPVQDCPLEVRFFSFASQSQSGVCVCALCAVCLLCCLRDALCIQFLWRCVSNWQSAQWRVHLSNGSTSIPADGYTVAFLPQGTQFDNVSKINLDVRPFSWEGGVV